MATVRNATTRDRALGAIVLILNIVFTLDRTRFLSEFASGDLLTAISYSVPSGDSSSVS